MDPFKALAAHVADAIAGLQAEGAVPAGLDLARVAVEPPRDPAHGHAATNAALVLARPAGMKPMALAQLLATALARVAEVTAAQAAPPGFVNLSLAPSFWQRQIGAVLRAGPAYGRCDLGQGRPINVEYCSTNPTGPLHVGHVRGTVFGDTLANLLAAAGYAVIREYYVNDGGAQIEALARSLHLRYREALGEPVGPIPEGLYPGGYLVPVAQDLVLRHGAAWQGAPEASWLEPFRGFGVDAMMTLIRDDLAALGVHHDVFTSERALIAAGAIDRALDELDSQGLLYRGVLPPPKGKPSEDWEPVEQLLFRSTGFGDDSDRPLRRSTGDWTYFAADIAYHLDKFQRGFPQMIDVLGADHAGYRKRMQAATRAVTRGQGRLEVEFCALVNLLDAGRPLRMSKRAGRIVTARDVVDEVGKDVVRFIMLTRRNDAPLDFDLTKVTEQSKDNPVFYVQYAHARICSVFRNAAAEGVECGLDDLELALLTDPSELALLREIASYPRVLEAAAVHLEPHRIAYYLEGLAGVFHGLWTRGKEDSGLRFLLPGEPALTRARLAMLAAARVVLANGLLVMGVQPVEEMR